VLTPSGATAVADFLAVRLDGGSIRVGNDSDTASVPIQTAVTDGDTVTVRGVFPELEANFDWRYREVLDSDGTVIDRDDTDFGRKVLGAVWAVDVPITVAAA
jgi:hypothetical protein